MFTSWMRSVLVAAASAALSACSTPDYVAEHPVMNAVPQLPPGVYSVSAVDVRPISTHEVEPDFPSELESILVGKAVVAFTVRTDGKVADAMIVQADDVQFGEAAVDAVRHWRFRPALMKGVPVDCRMTLPFIFNSPYSYYSHDGTAPIPSGDKPPGGVPETSLQPK